MVRPMNTPAIHQAMRLNKDAEDLAWLFLPDSDLPEGISDLLRLCASPELLNEFADNNGFDSDELANGLFNFIEKVMLDEKNSNEKILGGDKFSSAQMLKFHYKLLMKMYHPDHSDRPNAEYYSSIVTTSHHQLKEKQKLQDSISFSESRKPPQSYYRATNTASTQISNAKTALALVSAFGILVLVSMAGKLYGPSNSELIVNKEAAVQQEIIVEEKNLIKVTAVKTNKTESIIPSVINASSNDLQTLIKDLEFAYEKGDVDVIKPILANTPEIKNQTDEQLNDKLETLFEITNERKMLLFDFDWTSTSSILKGQGKFLSRYKLTGETKWLTREGKAFITAKNINNKLKITQLTLENQSFE